MSKEVEEFYKNNAVMNGTVLMNPITILDGFLESRIKAISDEEINNLASAHTFKNRDVAYTSRISVFKEGVNDFKNKLLNK